MQVLTGMAYRIFISGLKYVRLLKTAAYTRDKQIFLGGGGPAGAVGLKACAPICGGVSLKLSRSFYDVLLYSTNSSICWLAYQTNQLFLGLDKPKAIVPLIMRANLGWTKNL